MNLNEPYVLLNRLQKKVKAMMQDYFLSVSFTFFLHFLYCFKDLFDHEL